MNIYANYLRLPQVYTDQYLGGLHWSVSEDAIEFGDGRHFVFRPELALFIEGFGSVRSLIPFVYILHMLCILVHGKRGIHTKPKPDGRLLSGIQSLGPGDESPQSAIAVLHQAYGRADRRPRNAGVVCGVLCRDVPAAPGELSVDEVVRLLTRHSQGSLVPPGWLPPESNYTLVEPSTVLAALEGSLCDYPPADLEHWMRHGSAPVENEARQLSQIVRPPQTLARILTTLLQAPRLASAVPFLPQLISALSIPPRRLERSELAIGGYADIASRGRPEQLLPGQFALDKDEFTRRFAENELLYFRREEPPTGQRDELVLLLDQGVRTWGIVRSLLGAAALALVKLADRRQRRCWLAATSNGGKVIDPLEAETQSLTNLIEASDLSANPGLALETLLETRSTHPRDIVLLTHPRNLLEQDVIASASRLRKNCRLFGLTATADGKVEFVELVRGALQKMASIRIDLEHKKLPAKEPAPVRLDGESLPYVPWTGDVEPYGYPFWFGLVGTGSLFDFDYHGQWIFIEGYKRIFHAIRLDGTQKEILPRLIMERSSEFHWQRLIGVVGGFCLGGVDNGTKIVLLAHYDVVRRNAATYSFGQGYPYSLDGINVDPPQAWSYDSDQHAICVSESTVFDLALGKVRTRTAEDRASSSANEATQFEQGKVSSQVIPVSTSGFEGPNKRCMLALDASTGVLELVDAAFGERSSVQPLSDGKAVFAASKLKWAVLRENTLAIAYTPLQLQQSIALLLVPEGKLLCRFDAHWSNAAAMSNDGLRLALWERGGGSVFAVHDVMNGGQAILSLGRGKCHNRLAFALKPKEMLVTVGATSHWLYWSHGVLGMHLNSEPRIAQENGAVHFVGPKEGVLFDWLRGSVQAKMSLPTQLSGRAKRLVSSAESALIAASDGFGHVFLFEKPDRLLCIFFFFRASVAVWMPDGTRWGPPALIGGAPTPGALEKIGLRLLEGERNASGVGQ